MYRVKSFLFLIWRFLSLFVTAPWQILLLFLFISQMSFAKERQYDWAYVDANQEMESKYYWVSLNRPPEISPIGEDFFGPEISQEIRAKYQSEFGYTQIERGIEYADYEQRRSMVLDTQKIDDEAYLLKQKKFGEFVVRRTIERKIDDAFRRSQNLKTVYETKERISNLEMESKAGWKVKANYNLSGNYVDVKWTYPQLLLQWTSYLRSGLGAEGDHRFRLNKQFEKDLSTDLYFRTSDDTFTIVLNKTLSPQLRWQWQTSSYLGKDSALKENPYQHYVGFSYTY